MNDTPPTSADPASRGAADRPGKPGPHTRILVVDDERVILQFLEEVLTGEGYDVETAGGGALAIQRINAVPFDLVLTDLKMPSVGGIEILHHIARLDRNIMTIVMTGYATVETAVEALKFGAEDYIIKPFQIDEILIAVSRALQKRGLILENQQYQKQLEEKVIERTDQLRRAHRDLQQAHVDLRLAYDETLRAISALLELKDTETEGHSQRVTEYTIEIGRRLGVPDEQLVDIWRGALLHDIGKVGIPDSILLKPGPLTPEERMVMETHSVIGYKAIEGISFLREASNIVLCHQEKWDGTGYPQGLKGEEIPIGARLFAVADTCDAITSDRPYRAGRSLEVARKEIARFSGRQFDPRVVEAFMTITEEDFLRMGARFAQPPLRADRTEWHLNRARGATDDRDEAGEQSEARAAAGG